MKNKFYIKRAGITIIVSFFFFTAFTQTSQNTEPSASGKLFQTWYESPHEGRDGNTVFMRNKYVPVPGIDKQEERFGMLVINNDGTFIKAQYCGYCPNITLEEKKGNCEPVVGQGDIVTGLKVTFPNETKNTVFEVISYSEDKLILNFQKTTNTK